MSLPTPPPALPTPHPFPAAAKPTPSTTPPAIPPALTLPAEGVVAVVVAAPARTSPFKRLTPAISHKAKAAPLTPSAWLLPEADRPVEPLPSPTIFRRVSLLRR